MRYQSRKQAEGKTTLLGVGWIFPHCHWRASEERKNPEDVAVLRVNPSPLKSAAAVVATVAIITAPAVVAVVVAIVLMPVIAWGDVAVSPAWWRVNDRWRTVRHGRRAVGHDRRTVSDGWRTGRGDHHGCGVPHRHTERNSDRHTRLRRGGEPSEGGHCGQPEEEFISHARSTRASTPASKSNWCERVFILNKRRASSSRRALPSEANQRKGTTCP